MNLNEQRIKTSIEKSEELSNVMILALSSMDSEEKPVAVSIKELLLAVSNIVVFTLTAWPKREVARDKVLKAYDDWSSMTRKRIEHALNKIN